MNTEVFVFPSRGARSIVGVALRRCFNLLAARAGAFHFGELLFAKANTLWRDLQIFVLGHRFETALDRQFVGRDERDRLVGTGGSHVGEIFVLRWIYGHLFAL